MISIDAKNMEYAQQLLGGAPKEIKRAIKSSINKSTKQIKTKVARLVRERYVISSAVVKKKVEIRKATLARLTGVVMSTGRPATLTRFDVRKSKKGPIRVRVLRSSNPKPIKGLFLQATRAGNGPFPFKRLGKSRYPLTVLHGPSIPSMMGNENTINRLTPFAENVLNRHFLSEVYNRFSKMK